MTRAWGSVIVAVVLSCFVGIFVVARIFADVIPPESFDFEVDAAEATVRVLSFFVRPSESAYVAQLRGWEWLPQVVALVLIALLTFAAVRAVGAGWVRVGVLVIGSFVLAMGIADVVAMTIVVLRDDELWKSAPIPQDLPLRTVVTSTIHLWPGDALFVGFLVALALALTITVYAVLGIVVRRTAVAGLLRSFAPAPLVRDVPRSATRLATFGVIPIALLAFLGGADTYHYAYERYDQPTAFQNLSDWTFYLRLRPTAPPDNEIGLDATVGLDRWLPQSVVAIVALVALWSLLRWGGAVLKLHGHVGSAAVFVAAWALVVVALVLTGVFDAVLADQVSARADDPRTSFSYLSDRLPDAARFAVLWGWTAALAVTLHHRRLRPAADQH